MVEAYPLQWPAGWPRTDERKQSNFRITVNKARQELINEINLLCDDRSPVISSNVPLRKSDRQMYSDVANDRLTDPGVAVYFVMNGKQMSIACDKWVTPAENVRALALSILALRGLNRWGSSQIIERAFFGFQALPEVTTGEINIWPILGLNVKPATKEEVERAYKKQAKLKHPDVPTGSEALFMQLQDAYKKAIHFYE